MPVRVKTQSFTADNGEIVQYDRLVVDGYIAGTHYEVEFKGDKNALKLAHSLLQSTETKPTVHATNGGADVNVTRQPAQAQTDPDAADSWLND